MIGLRPLSGDELRRLQLSEFEILLEFKKICEKHGLRYYLTAGTLLGAVRHGGFIPWDDDVDVAMPRSDYDRLAEVCKTELPANLFFQSSETDRNFPFFFSKLRRHGTEVFEPHLEKIEMHKGQYIDIFPLDRCPRKDWAGRLFFKTVEVLTCAYVSKVDENFTCGYKKWYMIAAFRLASLLSLEKVRTLRRTVAKLPRGGSGRLCTVGGAHGYPAETYDTLWFEKTEYKQFESVPFPVPSGWDSLLTNMYGDYMLPPKQANRAGHFLTQD